MSGFRFESVDSKHRINGELYHAIIRGDRTKVKEMCQRFQDHALHIVTINDDTVLHLATYAQEARLALYLLDELPDSQLDKITRQNSVGNTILHEAATSDDALPIAEKLLRRAPGLLGMRDKCGESVVFQAARYGKPEIFKFLAAKIAGIDQASQQFYLYRSDKTSILHISVLGQHYEMALLIANEYPSLIGEKDSDGMTALQLLSCDSSTFNIRRYEGFINIVKLCCSPAWRDKLRKEKQKHKLAIELAKILVRRDTSWELTFGDTDTAKPKLHRYGKGGADALPTDISTRIEDRRDTPLFSATKSGCVEIVKQILDLYPQAVEHIDSDGRNILHVAIKYRQLEIFNFVVEKMDLPLRRLARHADNFGNSILHSVGLKDKNSVSERIEGPAILLQEELRWFEVQSQL